MTDNLITFISNNVKEIQTSQKRIKLFEYLKSYVATNGFVFLQETHPSIRDEKKWKDEFRGRLFFSHGKTNSCGVLIGYYGTKKIKVINKKCDKYGRILILEINIEDRHFVLINIYNANNELDHVKTLTDLSKILDCVDNILFFSFFFFSIWVFFHERSRFTGQQGKGEGIYLTPLYHFHPLHRHLDISRAITTESSPLHIAGSRTRTGNLWFPSASR